MGQRDFMLHLSDTQPSSPLQEKWTEERIQILSLPSSAAHCCREIQEGFQEKFRTAEKTSVSHGEAKDTLA